VLDDEVVSHAFGHGYHPERLAAENSIMEWEVVTGVEDSKLIAGNAKRSAAGSWYLFRLIAVGAKG
jgi:hypothetical protein